MGANGGQRRAGISLNGRAARELEFARRADLLPLLLVAFVLAALASASVATLARLFLREGLHLDGRALGAQTRAQTQAKTLREPPTCLIISRRLLSRQSHCLYENLIAFDGVVRPLMFASELIRDE